MIAYCQQVASVTGITLCVIDRAVHSVKMAGAFETQGRGWLSMLDAKESEGLASCEAQGIGTREDGSEVYEGQWHIPRPGDPRRFVIVGERERVVVFWGTSAVTETLEPLAWPSVSRERNATLKRMIDHGALNVPYGIKKLLGPDRHQMRAREEVNQALVVVREKVEKKERAVKASQEKVAKSQEKGHTTRLHQRARR
jgi:hypothetical protein